MEKSRMIREDILRRLNLLDEEAALLFPTTVHYKMILLGGSALMLQRWLSRATYDIDAVSVPPELAALLDKYDINTKAEAYLDHAPYNYPDRVVAIDAGGQAIDYYTLSLEDLVITKLCSIRDTDWCDAENQTIRQNINWNLLDQLAYDADELRASILSDREYAEFLTRYKNYTERWRP